MKSEYRGSTTLICTSCGSKNLQVSNDKSHAKCNACQRDYPGGYDELVRLNQPRIYSRRLMVFSKGDRF